jgi:hypothetical protein
MDVAAEFRRCLEELDAPGVRKLWRHVSPHLPAPADDAEALSALHMARTVAEAMPLKLRAYSHRWLLDHGLPSQLPDRLKPSAERLYPRVVDAVGISVNFSSPLLKPAEALVRKPMEDAVMDCFANGDRDPALVSARMAEAKAMEMRALFGRRGLQAR